MLNVSHSEKLNSSLSEIHSCKFCAGADLYLDQRGPNIGYFCRGCRRWQGRWIRHSEVRRLRQSQANRPAAFDVSPKPYRPTAEQIGLSLSPRDDVHQSCKERFEKLECKFANYEDQLDLLVKAILSCGILQGKGGPPEVDVDDRRIDGLARELGEDEAD